MALAAYHGAIAHRRKVGVAFRLKHAAEPGQRVKLVGGHKSLGEPRVPAWQCAACCALPGCCQASAPWSAHHHTRLPSPHCHGVQGCGRCTTRRSCSCARATSGRPRSSCRQVGGMWMVTACIPQGAQPSRLAQCHNACLPCCCTLHALPDGFCSLGVAPPFCTAGSITEYKYALLDSSGNVLALQAGNNGVLAIRMNDQRLEVQDTW